MIGSGPRLADQSRVWTGLVIIAHDLHSVSTDYDSIEYYVRETDRKLRRTVHDLKNTVTLGVN